MTTTEKKLSPKASRAVLYDRNLEWMRQFKESRGCQECEATDLPHYVLDTIPSIAGLAGSRCSLEALQTAAKHSKVVCANCRRAIEWRKKHPKQQDKTP